MRETVVKFIESRRKLVTTVAVLCLLACVAGVFGYCYVGPISIDEDDLLSATVFVQEGGGHDIEVDLTDPAMREEVARLLNGLHRWYGSALDCEPNATLAVELRHGGPACCVWLYCNDALLLWIGGSDPDHERRSVWVKSAGMVRFLEQYCEMYY